MQIILLHKADVIFLKLKIYYYQTFVIILV